MHALKQKRNDEFEAQAIFSLVALDGSAVLFKTRVSRDVLHTKEPTTVKENCNEIKCTQKQTQINANKNDSLLEKIHFQA